MKSYAHKNLPLKRIKELAAEFSDDEVRASLGEDADYHAFLFEPPDGNASIMWWDSTQGLMACLNDDSVQVYAQVEFLRRHGYPVARCPADIGALVERHGWPRRGPQSRSPGA